jgi:hypothetical protein
MGLTPDSKKINNKKTYYYYIYLFSVFVAQSYESRFLTFWTDYNCLFLMIEYYELG